MQLTQSKALYLTYGELSECDYSSRELIKRIYSGEIPVPTLEEAGKMLRSHAAKQAAKTRSQQRR